MRGVETVVGSLLDTSSFRSISAGERSAMNTSASELAISKLSQAVGWVKYHPGE